MDWMILPLKRYADFEGRSRRTEFWMFALLTTLIYAIGLTVMVVTVGFGNMPAGGSPPAEFWVFFTALMVFALGTVIPNLAVQVRRFHDQDKSGWFVLLGFIPYVGGIILLVFMCIEGTRGPNRFGPDPKDPDGRYDVAPWQGEYREEAPLPQRPDLG